MDSLITANYDRPELNVTEGTLVARGDLKGVLIDTKTGKDNDVISYITIGDVSYVAAVDGKLRRGWTIVDEKLHSDDNI